MPAPLSIAASAVVATAVVLPELVALALLATVQGLTEFLPISSSGHLVLAQALLGWEEPGLTIDVVVHLGTLVAVLLVYREDVVGLGKDVLRGKLDEALLVVVATLPIVYVGLAHGEQVEELFGSTRFAATALFGTAAILLVGEWARRRNARGEEEVRTGRGLPTWAGAVAIGVAQSLAILPGISRSGSTIAAGLLVGLAPQAAARFSFLMAIPAILGAAVLKLPDVLEQESGTSVGALLFAAAVAAGVGWLALRLLLAFLGRGAFGWFALYCALLGGVTLLVT